MESGYDGMRAAEKRHGDNDPEFNWEKYRPKIAHNNTSGETIKNMKNKIPPGMMKSSGSN